MNEVTKPKTHARRSVVLLGIAALTAAILVGVGFAAVPPWGTNNVVITDINGANGTDTLTAANGPNNYFVGTSDANGDDDFAVVHYDKNSGALDPAFGTSGVGVTLTDHGDAEHGAAAVELPNGSGLVVGGYDSSNFLLARYSKQGVLDTTFGTGGFATVDFGGTDVLTAIKMLADGRILAVGTSGGDFAIAQLGPNGQPDTSFSGDGMQTVDFGGNDRANAVTLTTDGHIVVVGNTDGDVAVARLSDVGVLDPKFSLDGKTTWDGGGTEDARGGAMNSGNVLVAGTSGGNFFFVQFSKKDGSLDPKFNHHTGRLDVDFGGTDQLNTLVQEGDKNAWYAVGTSGGNFIVAKVIKKGVLDPNFDTDGKATADLGGNDVANAVNVVFDSKGNRVYVGGTTDVNGTVDFAIVRYVT